MVRILLIQRVCLDPAMSHIRPKRYSLPQLDFCTTVTALLLFEEFSCC